MIVIVGFAPTQPLARQAWVLLRWSLAAPSSETFGSESHSLRFPLRAGALRPGDDERFLDGWPSGLRRTIGNRVG